MDRHGRSWDGLWDTLGAFGAVLEASWGLSGLSWKDLGLSWAVLELLGEFMDCELGNRLMLTRIGDCFGGAL